MTSTLFILFLCHQGRLFPPIHRAVHGVAISEMFPLAGGRSRRLHGAFSGDIAAVSRARGVAAVAALRPRHFLYPPRLSQHVDQR